MKCAAGRWGSLKALPRRQPAWRFPPGRVISRHRGGHVMMQVTWSVFPKFHKHLDPPGLAAFVRDIGVDTTNMIVREGYWVTPGPNLAAETMKFVDAMKREGIDIHYATTGFTLAELIKDPTPLQVFHDNGIRAFRLGHVNATND